MIKPILIIFFTVFSLTTYCQDLICDCVDQNRGTINNLTINIDTLKQLTSEFKHAEGIQLCLDYLVVDSSNKTVYGYLGEFLYNNAEVRSGNNDPQIMRNMLYMDDGGESDPIGYEIYMIKNNSGPNFWTDEVISDDGELSMCIINCFRKTNTKFTGYYLRYLTTILAMQKFEKVIAEMKSHNAEKLDVNGNIGDFYAQFTERYIGYNEIENGLKYLLSVKSTYPIDKETRDYWTNIFNRLLDDSVDISEQTKGELYRQIKQIE